MESQLGDYVDGVIVLNSDKNVGEIVGKKLEEIFSQWGEWGWSQEVNGNINEVN